MVSCIVCAMPDIYAKWQHHIVRKINKSGSHSLNLLEKASIYSFASVITVGGLLHGYPEVSKEQAYMLWRGTNKRSFKSDFAMEAPEIRRAAIKFAKRVRNKKNKTFIMPPRHISLKYGKTPYRVILALNPPTMSAKAIYNKNKKDWKIAYKITVPVKYSKNYRNRIPTALGTIVIYQKIFWALQQTGWLHPYDAEWSWNVMAKDLADS